MKMCKCSKCGNHRGGWWDQWPSYGRIEIGIASRMSKHMKIPFNHSLVKSFSQQGIILEWGDGYRFPKSEYGLCADCQKDLVELIGNFFATDNTTK